MLALAHALPRVVLTMHLVLFVLGCVFGPSLISMTSFDMHPPASAESSVARARFHNVFPATAAQAFATIVVVSSVDPTVDVTLQSEVHSFDVALQSSLRAVFGPKLLYESFFSLQRQGLNSLANATLSPSRSSTMIRLGIESPTALTSGDGFANLVDATVDALGPKRFLFSEFYFVGATGPTIFSRDLRKQTEHDLVWIDLISLPVSLLVLAIVLRSIRLLILPVLNILVCIATSFLLVRLAANYVRMITLVPSIMMSSSVAFSIDYSLFLLSRYREEILARRDPELALDKVLKHSGHTVLVSGTTLAMCWFVLTTFPEEMVSSVGIGAGITTCVCVAVNLTLTPSMLVLFPVFFSNLHLANDPFQELSSDLWAFLFRQERRIRRLCRMFFVSPLCCCCCFRWLPVAVHPSSGESDYTTARLLQEPLPVIEEETASMLSTPPSSERPMSRLVYDNLSEVHEELDRLERDSPRVFGLVQCVTHTRARSAVILAGLIVLVLMPFSILAWNFGHSNSFLLQIPRGKLGTVAFERLEQALGPGKLNPYFLIVSSPKNESVLSQWFFNKVTDSVIRDLLLTSLYVNAAGVQAIMWINSMPIPFDGPGVSFQSCARLPIPKLSDTCRTLKAVASESLSAAQNTIYIKVELLVEPNSRAGTEWLKETRKQIAEQLGGGGAVNVQIAGGAAETIDVVEGVYSAFPRAILLTSLVVLGLVAIAFRSIVVPLRCLLTIAFTLAFVYGLANLVFQRGMLEWAGLSSPGREVHWCAPVMLFGVLVGLAMDYDIFLLTRIVESRCLGFSESDAIRAGFTASFPVITAAGFIMIVAFGGLLASKQPIVQQMSFFLVTSLVFDTFVARGVLVPAIMRVLGEWNWWPRRLPPLIQM